MNKYFIVLAVSGLFTGLAQATASETRSSNTTHSTFCAIQDSTEYQKFKAESQRKIRLHEKEIADLKAKMADENKEVREKFDQKVAAIEKKNNALKQKIANYKADEKDSKWKDFKRDFNKGMEELGQSMKDLVKDKK